MTAITRSEDGTWLLQNELVSVVVNTERGADILSFVWNESSTELLWRNPRTEALPPRRGDYDLADSSYFDNYPGGIQEIFPNAGSATEVGGAQLPFHGEALRRPWAAVVEGDSLVGTTALARYPFRMRKTFRLEGSVLHFDSRVENVSTGDLPVHWGLHPTFNTTTVAAGGHVYGAFDRFVSHPVPFAAAQSHAPASVIAGLPVAPGVGAFALTAGDAHTADLVYATVDAGWFGLRSPGTDLLVTMTWPKEIFPELWVWQECRAPGGYPWWGTEHIVGVEPQTTSPFTPLASEPHPLVIEGGGVREASFTLGVQPIEPNQVPVGVTRGVAAIAEEEK